MIMKNTDGSARITNCRFFLLQYTSKGFEEKIAEHRNFHLQKMKKEREERQNNKSWPFRVPFRNEEKKVELPVAKRDYSKLVLTMYDMVQFELHAIKIDEDCVIDGYSDEYRP